MIDALKEEEIVNKVGGRFKLSTLIQKRLAAINAGARVLVDFQSNDKMEVVVQEILQDKIYLDSSNQVKLIVNHESGSDGGPPELDLSKL
jgi:DNA-directed RNA polymerase subunit omega